MEEIGDFNFQLVFTTAYDRYAVKAFKYSAIDYLLKPTDPIELKATVQKIILKQRIDAQPIELLRRQLYTPRVWSFCRTTRSCRLLEIGGKILVNCF